MKSLNTKIDNQSTKFHTINKKDASTIKGGRFKKIRPIEVKDSNGQDGDYKGAINLG